MASIFRKTKVKLDLLSDIDMSLIVEKGNSGICHASYRYVQANNKYMKDYYKIKNRHNFSIGA